MPYMKEETKIDVHKQRTTYIESFGYSVLTEFYTRNDEPIDLVCPRGHEYSTTWIGFNSNGNRCPKCKSSRGENIIRYILDQYNIDFNEQYKIKYRTRNHFFDFYLSNHNTFIEYQGEQHYRTGRADKWLGEERINQQIELDRLKKEFCNQRNTRLVEIPYTYTPEDVHRKLLDVLNLTEQSIDLGRAEHFTKRLDVKAMLTYYRWHTVKDTAKKFGISEGQLMRYAKGTRAKIKPVKQIKNGKVIDIFDTQKEVTKRLGIQINSCLKGKTKTAGGFEWYYVTQQEYEEWRKSNG